MSSKNSSRNKEVKSLLLRVLLCFLPVSWISFILTPATVYAAGLLLKLFYETTIIAQSIIVEQTTFRIIEACVASFAFYLIWLLILLTKEITIKERIQLLIFCWGILFTVNVLRIIFLAIIAKEVSFEAFHAVHLILWKFMSGIFVAVIWIAAVKKYRIKSIPVYDDIKWLYQQSSLRKLFKSK